ncbi:hypothetical protein [Candidatus Electronema sp. PJ]|uniref:tetratricopeptide repeat protein n=1 Tax=Candidatus Electronema sp. PJ TaxID=3401572 RepID=UPI003AA9E005
MSYRIPPVSEKSTPGFSCIYCLFTAITVTGLLLVFYMPPAGAQETGVAAQASQPQDVPKEESKPTTAEKNSIVKITAQRTEKKLEITILCARSPKPEPNIYKLPPQAIIVDIADAEMQESVDSSSLAAFKVTLNDSAKASDTLRLEFNLPEPYTSYTASLKDNSIILLIENFFKDESVAPAAVDSAPLSVPSAAAVTAGKEDVKKSAPATPGSESVDAHLPTVNPAIKSPGSNKNVSVPTTEATPPVLTSLGGMNSQPITVDFYKVDLHNVFRLLGEISGYNIIVAEGVSGTLTLALHEVPWDFVLDIIINLKDLAKEQRHNTIVIYPKDKEFVWPTKAADINIDPGMAAGKNPDGTITIRPDEQHQQPEVTEAKKIVAQAVKVEKEGNLEAAIHLYEKALDIWPDKVEKKEKSKLANKIASIYLAGLNQNAKAVYYAKKALTVDKKNNSAALNAAIGHANMEESSQAQQYFDQSISIGKPSREALFNYAVFSERQKQYDAALRLLDKYSELYGEDLDSMVSRARILDQQGLKNDADKVYTAILHAGFSVPQDLRAFILNRTRSN